MFEIFIALFWALFCPEPNCNHTDLEHYNQVVAMGNDTGGETGHPPPKPPVPPPPPGN